MTIVITLHTHEDEAARQEGSLFETARLLELVTDRLLAGSWPMNGPVYDAGGNQCGTVTVHVTPAS
jgi:hypothetical protein